MKKTFDINLLPPEFRPAPAVRWLPPYLALVYSLAVFILIWAVASHFAKVGSLKADIESLDKSIKALAPFEKAYDEVKSSASEMDEIKKIFNALEAQYIDWPLFLTNLHRLVPESVWLTSVSGQVIKTESIIVLEKEKAEPAEAPTATPATAKGASKLKKKKEKIYAVHKANFTIEGSTVGQTLNPISVFLDRLKSDPYFANSTLISTALEEVFPGVRAYVFKISTVLGGSEEGKVENHEKEGEEGKKGRKSKERSSELAESGGGE